MNRSSSLRIALDTNLIMRMWARRYLATAIAASGHRLVLPQTAMELAAERYDEVCTRVNKRAAVERWSAINDPRIRDDPNLYTTFATDIAVARNRAFEEWLRSEPHATPPAWDLAPRTARSRATAVFLRMSGSLGDRKDRRYGGTGEDAQVLGETIEGGCVWIGSSNYRSLTRENLDTWLHRHDPKLNVHVPFIVHPDEAVQVLLPGADHRRITQIAYAVVHEPEDTPDRYHSEGRNLERLENGLEAGDLTATASKIAAYAATRGGFGPELAIDLERDAEPLLARTRLQRESDARRRQAEHDAVQRVPFDLLPRSQLEYGTPGTGSGIPMKTKKTRQRAAQPAQPTNREKEPDR